MKKLVSTLLALTMLLGLLSAVSLAESAEPVTLKVLGYERKISDNAFFSQRETQVVFQEIDRVMKENGINLEYEIVADVEQYRATLQTRLAANYNLPDLVYMGTMTDTDVLDLADQGIILKMNEILERTKGNAYQYFFGGEGELARNTLSDADDNFYWLPRIQMNLFEGELAGTSMGVCIRLDWLRELGLDVPQSIDEFTAALQGFQDSDLNGNGLKDEVAVLDTSLFGSGIDYWFGIVNGGKSSIGVNVTEGKAESAWYSPNIKEYFTYVKGLVDAGLLYADAIGSDTDTSNLQNENKVSALYYYPVGTYVEFPMIAAGHTDAYYVGILPFDAVPGTAGFYSEETPYLVYLKHGVTNAAADKLDTVAKYYDIVYSEEFQTLMDWGVEGSMYEIVDGEKKSLLGKIDNFGEKWDKGVMGFDELGRAFLPSLRHNERTIEVDSVAAAGYPEKAEFERLSNGSKAITPNDNAGYYALPTAEEIDILTKYTTDLETYSRELAANLSLGRASVDDMDKYLVELRSLGLDEVLAVRQAQLDRRNGK